MGTRTTLLLNESAGSETAAFFGRYHPDIETLPGFAELERRRWFDLRSRLVRVRTLRDAIQKLAPDLIVANEASECRFLWVYSLAGRIHLPPVVTFVHGSPFQFANDRTKYALVFRRHLLDIRAGDPVYRDLIPIQAPRMGLFDRLRLEFESAVSRAAIRMCRIVLALSHKNRSEIESLYGIRNVEVVCPGGYTCEDLDLAIQRPTPPLLGEVTRPILLSVCRLVAKKRVDLLLRAFQAFLKRDPLSAATLVVGGRGPEETSLRKLAEDLGLAQRVRLVGFIPDSELRDWYENSDVFLSADNADYDLTVMMALPVARKIVVTTQYEVPPELASLRRFFFVSSPDPAGLATAIASALATTVAPLDDNDRRELQSLTWESYFREVLDRSRRAISSPP